MIPIFGTTVEITVKTKDEATARSAFHDIQSLFQQLHHDWHPWLPGELTQLNQAIAEQQRIQISQHLYELLTTAQRAEADSCGLFNAATGKLIHLWGFHTSDFPIPGPPPDQSAINDWLNDGAQTQALQLSKSAQNEYWAYHPNPKVRLDLSGIAKGAAVALAVQRLKAHSVSAAIVNAGGDILAYTKSDPWRIAIRHPFNQQQPVLAIVQVEQEEAIFTSGNYTRFRNDGEKRYAHILDPRSGWPVEHVAAVTVIHNQAAIADAAATALMVVREGEPWPLLAARMDVDKVLLIRQDGQIEMTPAMQKRLQSLQASPKQISQAALPSVTIEAIDCGPFHTQLSHSS